MPPDPDPSSPKDQPLPPRHRPSLDNLNQDTMERDLWSLEDDLEADDPSSKPEIVLSPRGFGNEIPAPRERRMTKVREPDNPLEEQSPANVGDTIQMNVNKPRPSGQSGTPAFRLSRTESEFDDLEHWDDPPKGAQIDDLPQASAEEPVPAVVPAEPHSENLPIEEESATASPPADTSNDDEFSPVTRGDVRPLSLDPHLRLSKFERIGLIALLGLLAAGGLATVAFSLRSLPTESSRTRTNHFPIKGAMIEVDSAVSYWRAPITDGLSPETVRRDTKLLPVLELQVRGGTGAIRVLFRDENHTAVGDAVTHAVRGAGTLAIAATAGFDDAGMHAAYRTGISKPWTIEVFEAASETAPGKDFKRLFEMNISTERR